MIPYNDKFSFFEYHVLNLFNITFLKTQRCAETFTVPLSLVSEINHLFLLVQSLTSNSVYRPTFDTLILVISLSCDSLKLSTKARTRNEFSELNTFFRCLITHSYYFSNSVND
jgi:hypothetical protein